MCRCCQSCLEDIYWNCIEERFCYDESIANYNPDEDDYYKKRNGVVNGVQSMDNNNMPICDQPSNRRPSVLSAKIHEEDYRREIQTTVPILAPEILAVFANSQIFYENQPKLTRNTTKNYLPGIHGKEKETDEEKLIRRLEDLRSSRSASVSSQSSGLRIFIHRTNIERAKRAIESSMRFSFNSLTLAQRLAQVLALRDNLLKGDYDLTSTRLETDRGGKTPIKFSISPDSPAAERRSISPNKFHAIIEEEANNSDKDEVILRPQNVTNETTNSNNFLKAPDMFEKKGLRNVKSVPYFPMRPASENDIFVISESSSRISMTPEIPSISYSNLPKNYEDTPTVEKYKESTSLYSIQTANIAKAMQMEDYSMPRYFRKSGLISQSNDSFISKDELSQQQQQQTKRYEKSRRLKNLRDSLPPLRIHSIRHKFREEKSMD